MRRMAAVGFSLRNLENEKVRKWESEKMDSCFRRNNGEFKICGNLGNLWLKIADLRLQIAKLTVNRKP